MAQEPLVAILPADHKLARHDTFNPERLVNETYIGISKVPRVLRSVIADYFGRHRIQVVPAFEIDNYAMAISLVASTRGLALLPASAKSFLPASVVSRPLTGKAPMIDIAIGFRPAKMSPILKTLLAKIAGERASEPDDSLSD